MTRDRHVALLGLTHKSLSNVTTFCGITQNLNGLIEIILMDLLKLCPEVAHHIVRAMDGLQNDLQNKNMQVHNYLTPKV